MITPKEELSVVTPADWVPGPPQDFWTYEDYAALPDDGHRYEIVNGVLVMAPAPTPEHQDIVGEIYAYLRTYVKLAGFGRVFMGPIDVVLGPKNVFQPDVLVVLNAHLDRIQAKKMVGAPDLVVEVMSPGSGVMDRIAKYAVYARAGVTEYWIVKPDGQTIEVFVLEAGEYHSLGVFRGQEELPSRVVPGLSVHVEQFFA
jgi:Uma2 family endonuclease